MTTTLSSAQHGFRPPNVGLGEDVDDAVFASRADGLDSFGQGR
ncbi:hypothetical protein SGRIM128S_02589 [Streptomyces griseomycini]